MAAEVLSLGRIRGVVRLRSEGLLRNGVWALADQSLIKATNFVTMVLLARHLSPSAFGAFTLAYTVLLFANNLQAALVTQPHNVLGATRQGEAYIRYTTSTGVGQVIFAAIAALLAAIAAGVADLADAGASSLLFALAPAIMAWQLQEFTRRVLYTKGKASAAFANDIVSYGGQILGVLLLASAGALTPSAVVGVLGATSALAFVLGLWQIRTHLQPRCNRRELGIAFGENWRFSKWLLGSALLTLITTQLYPVLAAGFISLAATGAIRAMQTIMGPANILLNTMTSVFTPKVATVHAAGDRAAFRALVGRMAALTVPVMSVYSLAVVVFVDPLLHALYGDQYDDYRWLLVLIALDYVLTALRTTVSIALRGMKEPSAIFRADLWSAVITLTLGVAALWFVGVIGAGLAWVVNGFIRNVVLWRRYLRAVGTVA